MRIELYGFKPGMLEHPCLLIKKRFMDPHSRSGKVWEIMSRSEEFWHRSGHQYVFAQYIYIKVLLLVVVLVLVRIISIRQ